MMFIVLFFLCQSVTNIEFHLDRQLPLCCMQVISAITPLSNGDIAVEAANPSVTILNGDNFTNKVAELQADSSISKILVTPDGGVYFGNGEKIIRKITQNLTNIVFSESVSWSNMVLTDKYALVGDRNRLLPIIKKLDLQKLKIETFTLKPMEEYYDDLTCLSNLKNGQIIFGEKYTVYLLNNETFQVEQAFVETERTVFTGTVIYIDSFWTPEESVILMQGEYQNYKTYRYNHDSKQFEYCNRFSSLKTQLILTSPNTAVSIFQQKFLYWEDFDSQVLARSWDQSDYIGSCRMTALSNSQVFFAMFDYSSIKFVTLTLSNNLSVTSTIEISDETVLQAKFSDDDVYLIYNQNNYAVRKLYKLDMTTKQQTMMMDGDQPLNALTFLLMGDRIVVFINRTTIDNIAYSCVQLRDIANFSLLSQLEVKLSITPYDFKLLGNSNWNFNFMLLLQNRIQAIPQSMAFKFRVVADQIQLVLPEIQGIEFQNSFACNKYLINIPRVEGLYESIQVYNLQTMSLVKKISNDFQYNTFFTQGDLLVAQGLYLYQGTFIYDFSKNIENFEKGLFFRQYFVNEARNSYKIVVFPKRQLYLIFSNGVGRQNPLKLIYDLTKIPVQKWLPLPVSQITAFVVVRSPTNSQCLWVFIVSETEKKLLKHNDCDPSNPQIVSNIPINFPKLFISNSQKYLLFVYNAYSFSSYEYTFEVRLTSNVQVLVKKFVIKEYEQTIQSIDITKDQKIIVHLFDHILVFDMEKQQNIDNLEIKSIDFFDASQDIVAMVGKSLIDPNLSLLIIKKINDLQPVLSISIIYPPKIVKLSQSTTRIAFYDSDSKLSVWNIKNQQIIIDQVLEGVINIEFINDNKIFLQFSSNFSIISLSNQLVNSNKGLSLHFSKIATNSDGTLFAALVSPTNVKVLDLSMNEVANFIAPANSNIVDVGFSSNNEVYAITSDGTLFVLSPTPCPVTFINIDSVCLCPQNTTNTGGVCQCKPTFVKQDNECLCINRFTFDGANCVCNANATIIGSNCICKETFVSQGNNCICRNEQTYINGKCIECSFMCSSCDGAGTFDCTQYSSIFYAGIAGISVIVIALIVIIVCLVKRRREKVSALQTNLTDNKSGSSKDQSSLSEQLYGETKDK